jgi:hypothetical protein
VVAAEQLAGQLAARPTALSAPFMLRVLPCSLPAAQLPANCVHIARTVLAACRKLSLSRKLPCSKCNGTGSKSGKRHSCSTCHGSGVQVHIRPLGPGMVQQIQSRCGDCGGSGYSSVPSEHITSRVWGHNITRSWTASLWLFCSGV